MRKRKSSAAAASTWTQEPKSITLIAKALPKEVHYSQTRRNVFLGLHNINVHATTESGVGCQCT